MLPIVLNYRLEYHKVEFLYADERARIIILNRKDKIIFEQDFSRREFFQLNVALNRFADEINDYIISAKPKH